MTITIDLMPDVEIRLREKAAERGQDAEVVAAFILRKGLNLDIRNDWEEMVRGIGIPTGTSLSDDAVSRESLYEDHL